MSVKVDVRQLERLQKQIEKAATVDIDVFCEDCAKELAARLLRKVIKRTPVGDYSDTYELEDEPEDELEDEDDGEAKRLVESGKVGGTLKRGWTMKKLQHFDDTYVIEIINPVEYASFVEYGHRQTPGRYVTAIDAKLKVSWVKGQFMLTTSEKEISNIAPKFLETRLNQLLKECFK